MRGENDAVRAEALVLSLDEVGASHRAWVGGKAAALGEMRRSGLPVPPGFCITTGVFDRILCESDAAAALADLAETRAGDVDQLARLAAEVRSRLAAATLPCELEKTIIDAWQRSLAGVACAVRSSATAEDLPTASFAGQQDTALNVRDAEALLGAIRRCWMSVFSDRALAYRADRGWTHADVRMAVVVQQLVAADVAGVLFTVNPLSGRDDELLIEASYGLGEAVVSGRVSPDRFVVHKPSGRVLERVLATKHVAVVPAAQGGVRQQAIESDAASAASLSDDAASRLAQIGVAAERLFTGPQDVEWAMAGGEVFVLQSRPVTTPMPSSPADDRQVWTSTNTGEILPDVVSPLTWSCLERTAQRAFRELLGCLGFDLYESPLFGRVAGRVYFNLNTLTAIIRAVPGVRESDVTTFFGGMQAGSDVGRALAMVEGNLPRVKLSWLDLLRRLPKATVWLMKHQTRAGADRSLAVFAQQLADRRCRDLRALGEAGLVQELESCVNLFWDGLTTLGGYVLAGTSYFGVLHGRCLVWLPDEPNAANEVVTGVEGMSSAEAGLDMWRLAALAHQRPATTRALLAAERFAEARAALWTADGGAEVLAQWDDFMTRHGHHARGEIELMNRRWAEDHDYVFSQVRSYLSNMGAKDPVATHRAQVQAAARRTEALRQRLRNPVRRTLFNFLLRRARHGLVYRENVKSEAVRLLARAREVALALGSRLAARGVLNAPDDVFFFALDELSALADADPAALRDRVASRRALLARDCELTPPPVVVGRLDTSAAMNAPGSAASLAASGACEPGADGTDRLCGLGVSPGVVIGPARVILRADADERVRPGEILVAPFTDPGWTPYFQLAAALVTDLGGLLSHGSIVAREYGLPAVVNVGPATRIIRTGDRLQVDGTRGEVRILERMSRDA